MNKFVGLVILFVMHLGGCKASGTSQKLQHLYCKIGNDLIKIKKEYPKAQPLVYALLDQFGQYHAVSKEVLSRKKEYKQLFKVELTQTEMLKKENECLKDKINEMKKVIFAADKKLKKDSEEAERALEQKNLFTKEKETFLKEKQKFEEEKKAFLEERDSLVHEKEVFGRERDSLLVAKTETESSQKKEGTSRTSNSAPRSPR